MDQKDIINSKGESEQGDSLQDFVSQHRDAFDHRLPDTAIKDRILSQLQEGRGNGMIKPMPEHRLVKTPRRLRFWSVAASVAALLVLGLVASLWLGRNNGGAIPVEVAVVGSEASQQGNDPVLEEPIQNSPEKTAPLQERQSQFINPPRPHPKVQFETRENRILALLEPDEPASKRMEALLEMASMPELSGNMIEKLKHTINHDPNNNVRSTAIGLLLGSLPVEERAQAIQEVFVLQEDPSIQLELMMAMASQDTIQISNTTAERLMAITENPLAFDFVKEQAYAVLLKTW